MRRVAAALLLVLAGAVAAAAAEFPPRKAGLWELKTTTPDGRTMTIQQCVDAQTDQAMQANVGSSPQQNCSKRDVQKSGNSVTVDSVCTIAGKTMTSHAVITGSFDSGYAMAITSQMQGVPPRSTNIVTKWLGACAADQKPGDMIMPNGMKMNLLDMRRGQGMPGAPGAPGAAQPPR